MPWTSVYRFEYSDLVAVTQFPYQMNATGFSPDGRYFLCGNEAGELQFWRVDDPKPAKLKRQPDDFPAEHGPLRRVYHSTRKSKFCNGDVAEQLSRTEVQTRGIPCPESVNQYVAGWESKSGRYVFYDAGSSWALWDINQRRVVVTGLPRPQSIIFAARNAMAAFEANHRIHLIDLRDLHHLTSSFEGAALGSPDELAFSKNCRFLLGNSGLSGEEIFDTRDLRLVGGFESGQLVDFWVSEAALSFVSTPSLIDAVSATVGRRLNQNGEMEKVIPAHWLRMHKEQPKTVGPLADKLAHWLLQYPEEHKGDPFGDLGTP